MTGRSAVPVSRAFEGTLATPGSPERVSVTLCSRASAWVACLISGVGRDDTRYRWSSHSGPEVEHCYGAAHRSLRLEMHAARRLLVRRR